MKLIRISRLSHNTDSPLPPVTSQHFLVSPWGRWVDSWRQMSGKQPKVGFFWGRFLLASPWNCVPDTKNVIAHLHASPFHAFCMGLDIRKMGVHGSPGPTLRISGTRNSWDNSWAFWKLSSGNTPQLVWVVSPDAGRFTPGSFLPTETTQKFFWRPKVHHTQNWTECQLWKFSKQTRPNTTNSTRHTTE